MAGLTDAPFRSICRGYGAAAATAEMLTANWQLWDSAKSRARLPSTSWPEPRTVQIAGADPNQLADAASRCVDAGAQIIDINMGCPAKKVCKKAAGSALLSDAKLVAKILTAVARRVPVPVTLKMRTGSDPSCRNAVHIASIAEDAGVQALAIHGRTRACKFRGQAEFDTIASVVDRVSIPVFANGDIDSPLYAKTVLKSTGAAGIMIGRGAMGQPWIFRQTNRLLATGATPEIPSAMEIRRCISTHMAAIQSFYGEENAPRFCRKHVVAYFARLGFSKSVQRTFNLLPSTITQEEYISECLAALNNNNRSEAA